MTRKVSLAALVIWLILASRAYADAACATQQLRNPAPTLADIYAMAEKHARAWKPDAVPASISTTSLGMLQPNGGAAGWHILFYSESAKSTVSIDTFRGSLNCFATPGPAGRIPDLKPDFQRDGAKLYAIAKQNGEALLAQGYGVMIGTAAASSRHATWNISYNKERAKDPGS